MGSPPSRPFPPTPSSCALHSPGSPPLLSMSLAAFQTRRRPNSQFAGFPTTNATPSVQYHTFTIRALPRSCRPCVMIFRAIKLHFEDVHLRVFFIAYRLYQGKPTNRNYKLVISYWLNMEDRRCIQPWCQAWAKALRQKLLCEVLRVKLLMRITFNEEH